MKKLEDIDKKQIFEVPEGYFDRLPLRIQERLAQPAKPIAWYQMQALRLAVPVVVLVAAGLFWLSQSTTSIEKQLGEIQDSELMAYLQDSDLNSEELEGAFQMDEEDFQELEQNVLSTFESSEDALIELIDDYTIESENF